MVLQTLIINYFSFSEAKIGNISETGQQKTRLSHFVKITVIFRLILRDQVVPRRPAEDRH